jgi:hypothetical protein
LAPETAGFAVSRRSNPSAGRDGTEGEEVIVVVKWLVVAASLAAALCWYKAATAKAPDAGGLGRESHYSQGAFSQKEGNQMLADAALQGKWNARAAAFATAAAVLTAVDVLIH